MTTRDERDARAWLQERYALRLPAVAKDMERRVIGAVWGANGYTTRDQADELTRRLNLRRGDLLLDVGTGRGWPGLHMAKRTGCSVVGTDLSTVGLSIARRRIRTERLGRRASVVAASGRSVPFRSGVFDAIVHTDVLC